ncbi:hypothetical protein POM88_036189 [Heracleum sosnowskyi]|uniref:Uncharacterized protein n=1 Tax=Heracleum sosnowskyi TaxID=360622 RepID=A0AAD8MEN3_9APIA|nr:hypothetical protein POM88_036189 [Heracleum sosnowskyi]
MSVVDIGGWNLCFDGIDGGDFCFDDLDIDGFMGCLDSDHKNNDKMINSDVGINAEETWASNSEILVVMDLAGGNLCFNDVGRGDFFFDHFDIDLFMGYLDSDQDYSKNINLEGTISGNNLEGSRTSTAKSLVVLDSGVAGCSAVDQCKIGGYCFDDLGGGDLCYDDINIDWFMRCLDLDKEEKPLEENTINKAVRRKFEIGDQELDKFCGGIGLDGLRGGDLRVDEESDFDIYWFMQCLDFDQKEQPVQDSHVDKFEKRGNETEFGGNFRCDN